MSKLSSDCSRTLTGLTLRLVPLLLAAAVFGAIAAPDWPTPPPAPPAEPPVFQSVVSPVDFPLVNGATRWEVQPIPQQSIPVIPPVAGDTLEVPKQVRLIIEAGALDRTTQLTYVPLAADAAPQPLPLQKLVKAFDLRSFDHDGREFAPEMRRPWLLSVSVGDLDPTSGDPSRLVFARFQDGRWLPLVTSYLRETNVLEVRILSTGRFAIIAEQPPV